MMLMMMMITLFCGKYIQVTVCHILSESADVCRRYGKNIFAYFFLGHSVLCIMQLALCWWFDTLHVGH